MNLGFHVDSVLILVLILYVAQYGSRLYCWHSREMCCLHLLDRIEQGEAVDSLHKGGLGSCAPTK